MGNLKHMGINFTSNGEKRSFSLWFEPDKPNHATVMNHLAKSIFYEPDVTSFMVRCLKQGDAFVDVGANLGYFTMLGRALVGPGGQVTSVEPGDNNISDLRRNIEGNNFSNCKIIDKPLAEREKPVDFYLNADDSGGNALWDVAAYPGNVKSAASPVKNSMISTTLSSLLADIDLPVRLVKIDTEGAEEIILRGGIEGLATKAVPFVITELHEFGLEKLGCHQKSLRGLMAWIGYDCYVLGLKGNMPVYIPPGTRIAAPFIVNLLFARPGTLNDLYPEVAVDPRLF